MKSQSTKELASIAIAGCIISTVLLLCELYYTNYHLISSLGININFLDVHFFAKRPSAIFDSLFKIRGIILISLAFVVVYPSTISKPESLIKESVKGVVLIIIFFISPLFKNIFPSIISQVVNVIVSVICWSLIERILFRMSSYIGSVNKSLTDNELYADGFEQNTVKMENEVSVNFRYLFHHKNELKEGFINVINPFKASYVIGIPGSGKSYAIGDEYIRQLINKGFSAVIYDYKDPTLSQQAYNHYVNYKKNIDNTSKMSFGYISFKHINSTHRCNPIKNICSAAEALDVANVMLVSLNKNFAEKQGEFFVESAGKFTALNIYVLGVLFQGKYQSLPHTISLLCRKASVAFPALKVMSIFYPDMKNLFSPFEDAFDNNVVQQLQGQLASAQIGLGSMSDVTLAFVMTEDEQEQYNISMDVNSSDKPMILCIGSDPQKDKVLGLANSVYLSRLSKVVNKKGTPCLFAVDELPTVFINGLDNLIATARSNKIAVLLGFQDFSQLIRDYGNKIANAIINTIGNPFVGAVKGETAKRLSESFGEKKVLKLSKSINEEGQVNVTHAEHKEKRIPADIIEELSQGEFVGRVADEFDAHIKHKVFHGSIQIDDKVKIITEVIPSLRNWSPEEVQRNLQLNLIRIDNEISQVLAELNGISSDYIKLRALTFNDEKSSNDFTLQNYLENSDDSRTHISLFIWLELAYFIIYSVEELDLKNDVLSFSEKFELLLRDVYTKDMDGINMVLQAIDAFGLHTIEDVQVRVNEYQYSKKSVSQNFDDYGA